MDKVAQEEQQGLVGDTSKDAAAVDPAVMRRRRAILAIVCLLVVMGFILGVTIALLATPPAPPYTGLRFSNAAVASEESTCSAIGRDILLQGGNAVDSVIATALCIGVINNFASGIGGGGFMIIDPGNGSDASFLDFREMAPAAAFREMYIGNLQLAKEGGLASGVPGELRGLELAYKLYGGKVPWKALFAPSIDLARNGFQVTPILFDRLQSIIPLCLSNPLWGKVYAPNGTLAQIGSTIYRVDLADTLEVIANAGSAEPFYSGPLAATMIQDLVDANGTMTLADLANYYVAQRTPLNTTYRGRTVLTGQAPSSGPVLLFLLNVLEGYTLAGGENSVVTYHRIVEAMKFAFAQRSYLGDPDYVANITVDIARMIGKEFANEVRLNITDSTTHPPEYYGGKYEVQPTPGTTHISAMDKDGLAVGMTSTVNLVWGSKVMTRSGIIMNNQMDDFSTPNTTNAFGLRASPSNYIQPGKRPLSSSTPTIVRNGKSVEVIAGASGGSRIITATLLTLLNTLDFGFDMQDAVNAPRIHDQLYPSEIVMEYLFPTALSDGLQAIGHNISRLSEGASNSAVQAIRRGSDRYLYPASDPRKDGLAAGY